MFMTDSRSALITLIVLSMLKRNTIIALNKER